MPEVERSDPPGQDAARVPIHDGHQIHEPVRHRDVADIGCPHLIRSLDGQRSGPRNLDSGLSEISIVFQAAVPKPVAPKYTTSGVRRPSEL